MLAKSVFTLLCALVCILFYIIGFWRKKAGEAAFAAARAATDEKERERYCRRSVLAGNRNACRMFCFSHPDIYESHQPLKPYCFRGMKVAFYGYYYPMRHEKLLSNRQRMFCHTLFRFKDGEIHGVKFFKSCMEALHLEEGNLHVMFMPCSSREKYIRRFRRLDEYISTHCPQMTSGLNDVVITGTRESLHKMKGGKKQTLKESEVYGMYRWQIEQQRKNDPFYQMIDVDRDLPKGYLPVDQLQYTSVMGSMAHTYGIV